MSNSHYQELDKLIREYDEDTKLIRPDKLIIINYPKVFAMSVASSFEFYIKECINDFLTNPLQPIASAYPKIQSLSQKNPNKPLTDKIYAKLLSYEDHGAVVLDATKFYDLFGGAPFRSSIMANFSTEQISRQTHMESLLGPLADLLGTSDKIDEEYAKLSDIKDRLDICSFIKAEQAFLSLKLRRNRVAHNYLHGLSDSFEDIRNFYYDAILYVVSLEKAISTLTAPIT